MPAAFAARAVEFLLVEHRDALERLAVRLIESETLDGSVVEEALRGPTEDEWRHTPMSADTAVVR